MSSIGEIFEFARLMRENRGSGITDSSDSGGSITDTGSITDISDDSDSDDDLDKFRVELEFRIKRVTKRRFLRCLDHVRSRYPEIQSYSYKENRVQIVGNGSSVFCKIVREDFPTETIVKTIIRKAAYNDLWCILLISTETDMRSMQRDHKKATRQE